MRRRHLMVIILFMFFFQINLIYQLTNISVEKQKVDIVRTKTWREVPCTGHVERDFTNLIEEYLKPWRHVKTNQKLITKRMYDDMEQEHYGYGVRVRIIDDEVYFRHFYEWTVDHYPPRLGWHLHLIRETARKYGAPNVEFFLGLSDGPKSVSDTSNAMAGLPLFSTHTSKTFLDVCIPDVTEYGAHGNYFLEHATIPWEEKKPLLYFRGSTTCFTLHADNWHMCHRIRAAIIGKTRPDLFDIGITKWSHVNYNITRGILNSTGIQLAPKEPLENQSKYKYIFDIEGGWGSSRKQSILKSGSVLFAHESPWFVFYEPLMVENRHYVRVDRHFDNMESQVEYAQQNDEQMKYIAKETAIFTKKYLTIESAVLYWRILLDKWADMFLDPPKDTEPVAYEHCTPKNPRMGKTPLGCSRGWMYFSPKDFVAAYKPFYPDQDWKKWEQSLPEL